MPWAAVIGAGLSFFGSRSSRKREKQAMQDQLRMQERQLGIQEEGLNFAKSQYGDWKAKYDPIYDRMLSHIDDGIEPDFEGIAGDVYASFDSARGQELRDMRRYGIRPTDGAYRQASRQHQLARSTAHVGERNRARQAAAGEKYRRLAGIHDSLRGSGSTLAGAVGNAYGRAGNAAGAAAGMFGDRAGYYGQKGAADAYGIGQVVGGIDWGSIWNDVSGWFKGSGGGSGGNGTWHGQHGW